MNPTTTICQCQECNRYFIEGAVVAVSFGDAMAAARAGQIQTDFWCGGADCAGIKAQRLQRESEHLKRFHAGGKRHEAARKERREGKEFCRTARVATVARQPYPDDDERFSATVEPQPAVAGQSVPALLSPGARQEEFIASGVTAKTDARVRDFLMAEPNFGKWFSRKLLKDVAQNDLINNIADRLRDELILQGMYVDNCMMSTSELGAKSSHYRICRIADAVSLTNAEKEMAKDESSHGQK